MSYKQKCLEIDPGLWCEKRRSRWNGKTYRVFASSSDGYRLIGEGESAASAWKNAWERLNTKN